MASDICLPVQVATVKDGVTVNDLSMALGFFVGAIVGALVAFLCAKICARDINRATTKRQVYRRAYMCTVCICIFLLHPKILYCMHLYIIIVPQAQGQVK